MFSSVTKAVIHILISLRWINDKRQLPLTCEDKEIYFNLQEFYFRRFKIFPDLVNPITYNEKIQWLKLFDHTGLHVQCSDKLKLGEYVNSVLGADYVNTVYQSADNFESLDFSALEPPFVIKTNHDSGSVFLITDKNQLADGEIRCSVNSALGVKYGRERGEWPYQYIEPKVFIERFINTDTGYPPADIKIHCSSGKVRFIQYIYDRGENTKEIILSPEWEPLNLRFDTEFESSDAAPQRPSNWKELNEVSEKLSGPFRYVRVDLYNENEEIIVGEMTFFPRGGGYTGGDQEKIGLLIDFNRSISS